MELSEQNKQQLLWDRIYRTGAAKVQADAVLATLDGWNAEVAQLFELKQEPFSLSQLRMLIAFDYGNKAVQPPPSVNSFIAVSYTWRTNEWQPVAPAYMMPGAERPIPICKALWDYLLDLRESEEEGIWIDQLCLDQNDRLEKTSAVASMDSLYASARLVFIALEDIKLTLRETLLLSDAFHKVSSDVNWKPGMSESPPLLEILAKIFSSRWFSRAWCFHEHHMSRQKVMAVLCEGASGNTDTVVGLVNLGDFILRLEYLENSMIKEEYPDLMPQMLRFLGGQGYAFSNVIGNVLTFGSQYVRDKVIITLNICRLAITLRPDVNEFETNDACLHLLLIALAAGDVTTLTTRGQKIRLKESLDGKSWLQWPNETSWSTRHDTPLREGITTISVEEISLDLLFIDAEYILPPTERAVQLAKTFLGSFDAAMILDTYRPHEKQDNTQDEDPTLMTLACAIQCGPSWMQRPWHPVQHELLDEIKQSYAEVENKKDICIRAIFPDQEVRDATTAFERLLVILVYGKFWAMSTCLMARNKQGIAMCDLKQDWPQYRVPTPSEHRLYGGARYQSFDIASTSLAVPAVMADEEYTLSDRLWLLQRTEDQNGSCWRVVEKVCLLGCPTLTSDMICVKYEAGQRVVG